MNERKVERCTQVPLWRECWYALRNFCSSWEVAATCYAPWDRSLQRRDGRGYLTVRWYVWPLHALVIGPLFGFTQAWGHFAIRGWPTWPWRVSDLGDALMGWVEKPPHVVRYVWLPPDSGDPNEIGFHVASDAVIYGERDPETFERPILSRPRCYQYPPEEPAIAPGETATWGSGVTYVYEWPA